MIFQKSAVDSLPSDGGNRHPQFSIHEYLACQYFCQMRVAKNLNEHLGLTHAHRNSSTPMCLPVLTQGIQGQMKN